MKRMHPYILAIEATAACWTLLYLYIDTNCFIQLYESKLQTVFFTAFLTVGSFLLAMKAFILVRIREDIYKHEEYKKRYKNLCDLGYKGKYYEGLIDLGNLLVVSVISCFITSISQITIGFIDIVWIKLIAPSLVCGMLTLVIIDWLFVYYNLMDWFEFIEKEMNNELYLKDKE